MSNLRDEVIKLLDLNPDVKTGGVGQDLIDYYADRLIALFNQHIEKLLPKDNTSMSGYMTASLDEIAGYQKALNDIKAKLKE